MWCATGTCLTSYLWHSSSGMHSGSGRHGATAGATTGGGETRARPATAIAAGDACPTCGAAVKVARCTASPLTVRRPCSPAPPQHCAAAAGVAPPHGVVGTAWHEWVHLVPCACVRVLHVCVCACATSHQRFASLPGCLPVWSVCLCAGSSTNSLQKAGVFGAYARLACACSHHLNLPTSSTPPCAPQHSRNCHALGAKPPPPCNNACCHLCGMVAALLWWVARCAVCIHYPS